MQETSQTLHGVFLSIFNQGVLLQGPSGSGKSNTALELLSRGHALIADDVPLFTRSSEHHLIGTCPSGLKNLLEIRALGIVDVHMLFGSQAIVDKMPLDLIVEFITPITKEEQIRRRLHVEFGNKVIMGVPIKHLPLPLALCQNVAILIESAVRLSLTALSPAVEQLLIQEEW